MTIITLRRDPDWGNKCIVEGKDLGSIGVGKTLEAALGRWLINNQRKLGIYIEVDETAQADEDARREKELSKR